MAVPVLTYKKQINLSCGYARKCECSSETSAVRSLIPTGTCNPHTSGTCSTKHEDATRAHPDNGKIKFFRTSCRMISAMHVNFAIIIFTGPGFFASYGPVYQNIASCPDPTPLGKVSLVTLHRNLDLHIMNGVTQFCQEFQTVNEIVENSIFCLLIVRSCRK